MPIPASLKPKVSGLDDTVVRTTIEVPPTVGGVHEGNSQVTFRLPSGTILDLNTLRLHGVLAKTAGQAGDELPAFSDSIIDRLEVRTLSGYTLASVNQYGEIVSLIRSNLEKDAVTYGGPGALWGWDDVALQTRLKANATNDFTIDGFRLGPLARNSQTPLWATDLLNCEIVVTLARPSMLISPGGATAVTGNYYDLKMTVDSLLFEQASYDQMIVAAKSQGFKLLFPNATMLAEQACTTAVTFNERHTSRSLDAVLAVPREADYRADNNGSATGEKLAAFQTSFPNGAVGSFIVNGHAMSTDMNTKLAYYNARSVIENLLPFESVQFGPPAWDDRYFLGVSLNAPRGRISDGTVGSSGLDTYQHPGSIQLRMQFGTNAAKVVKLWAMTTSMVEIGADDSVRVVG